MAAVEKKKDPPPQDYGLVTPEYQEELVEIVTKGQHLRPDIEAIIIRALKGEDVSEYVDVDDPDADDDDHDGKSKKHDKASHLDRPSNHKYWKEIGDAIHYQVKKMPKSLKCMIVFFFHGGAWPVYYQKNLNMFPAAKKRFGDFEDGIRDGNLHPKTCGRSMHSPRPKRC